MKVLLIRAVAMLIVLAAIFFPILAFAQPAEPHPGTPFTAPEIPPGDDVRVVVRAGERAPFEGVLFDGATLSRWTNRIQWLQQRLQLEHQMHLEIESAAAEATARYDLNVRQSFEREMNWLNAELDRTRQDLDTMRTRAQELEDRPWYRSFGFGLALGAGVVIGAGVVGAVLAK